MGRPRGFDEQRAVEAAMRSFWSAGYEATSTQDLCEATGLGRSSIYNTFRSKHDLFEKALARYLAGRTAMVVELLEGEGPVRAKVRALLWQSVDADEADPAGCLMVNSMVELAPRDPEIAAQLQRDHQRRLTALRVAIDAGRRAGEIDKGKDPEALAQFVIATITGMRVLARGGVERRVLEAIAATALEAI